MITSLKMYKAHNKYTAVILGQLVTESVIYAHNICNIGVCGLPNMFSQKPRVTAKMHA